MKRLHIVLPVVIVLSLLLSSCSMHLGLSKLLGSGSGGNATAKPTRTPSAPVSNISIVHGKVRPKNVTVKVGTTLTWTNNSDKPESVTSDAPGVFDSGLLAAGATWKYTFDKVGVYPYHSTASKDIFGSVTVTQ